MIKDLVPRYRQVVSGRLLPVTNDEKYDTTEAVAIIGNGSRPPYRRVGPFFIYCVSIPSMMASECMISLGVRVFVLM